MNECPNCEEEMDGVEVMETICDACASPCCTACSHDDEGTLCDECHCFLQDDD